jgi:predicted O-methyltransferase YrrM
MKLDWRLMPIGGNLAPDAGPLISTSLTTDETNQLRWLSTGADVLEIGSAYGYSTIAMAAVSARVTAVDPHIDLNSLTTLVSNLSAYQVAHRVNLRVAYSQDVLPALFAEGRKYDLVWIDGDHQAHAVTHDVQWALKLLHEDGVLACHDYDEDTCPGVRQALDAWKKPPTLVDTLAIYRPGEW